MITVRRHEFARGWPVVLATAFGAGCGAVPLASYSFSVLVDPLHQQFGWSRAEITTAPMFLSFGGLAAGVIAGAMADRFGARRVVLWSQVLLIAAFAAMTQMGTLSQFYAGYVAVAILGAGTMTMTWSRAVTGWFVAGRGLALGLSLVGTGLIGAALPTYLRFLMAQGGWQAAYLGLAALPLVLGLPLTYAFFREPEDTAPDASMRVSSLDDTSFSFARAVRTLCFWQMAAAFLILALAVSAVMIHTIPLLTDRGIVASRAAALAALIGISVTCGRLTSGFLLDRVRGPIVAFFMFALPAVSCLILLGAGNNLWLCGFAIALVGLAGGAEHDIAAYFCASFFGRAHYGKTYGLLYALYGIGAGLGPLLGGLAYDHYGSYDVALLVGAALFAASSVMILTLRPPLPIGRSEVP